MNVLLLLLCGFLQSPFDNPIIVAPTDYEYINFNEIVKNKIYVDAIMVDGRKIQVPVINGFVPQVITTPLTTGGYKREFIYDEKIKYEGQQLIQYSINKKPEIVKPKNEPKNDLAPMQEILKKHNEEICKLQETIKQLQKENIDLQEEIKKLKEPKPEQAKMLNSSMKKLSEVLN